MAGPRQPVLHHRRGHIDHRPPTPALASETFRLRWSATPMHSGPPFLRLNPPYTRPIPDDCHNPRVHSQPTAIARRTRTCHEGPATASHREGPVRRGLTCTPKASNRRSTKRSKQPSGRATRVSRRNRPGGPGVVCPKTSVPQPPKRGEPPNLSARDPRSDSTRSRTHHHPNTPLYGHTDMPERLAHPPKP